MWKYRNFAPDSGALLMGEVSPERGDLPKDPSGRAYQASTTLMKEADVYQMLLRGHAPQSKPFRDWVLQEVLPSIRKTGSYNVNESTTETGQQFAGE